MKIIITQEVEHANINKYGNADYQHSQYRGAITNSISQDSIEKMEELSNTFDVQIKELLETNKKEIQFFTVEAIDLFIDWDVFSFSRLMKSPNLIQNHFRKILLSLPLKISRITSIKNDNSDITYNVMSDALSQTEKLFNEKGLGGLR